MKKIFISFMLSVIIGLSAIGQIPTNGLVGYWPFNGNATDVSGNGNNGIVNGATLTTDRFGNQNSAYSFDGINDQIVVADTNILDITKNLSLCAWIKPASFGSENKIITKFPPNSYQLSVWNNKAIIQICPNGQPDYWDNKCISNDSININKWSFICGIYDYDNNLMKVYINGVLEKSVSVSGQINSGNAPVIIGNFYGGTNWWWHGVIDDIRIYNRALSATEILALYNESICKQSITVTDTLIINANLTGFNPITYQNNIKIYPNPTKDAITIDCGSNYNTLNTYTIKIINSLSQTVYSSVINKQKTIINLKTLSGKGIYFINLIDANSNIIETKKIILQ